MRWRIAFLRATRSLLSAIPRMTKSVKAGSRPMVMLSVFMVLSGGYWLVVVQWRIFWGESVVFSCWFLLSYVTGCFCRLRVSVDKTVRRINQTAFRAVAVHCWAFIGLRLSGPFAVHTGIVARFQPVTPATSAFTRCAKRFVHKRPATRRTIHVRQPLERFT